MQRDWRYERVVNAVESLFEERLMSFKEAAVLVDRYIEIRDEASSIELLREHARRDDPVSLNEALSEVMQGLTLEDYRTQQDDREAEAAQL